MANDARRTSQLGVTTSLSPNDRLVVLTNPASAANTQTITLNNFSISIVNAFPIANTTHIGLVQVDGNTITAAANGVISINTGNIVFSNNLITINTDRDINILGNNSGVNMSSNQYVQMTYSQDGSIYGGGNNQSYVYLDTGYVVQYVTSNDPILNVFSWSEKDYSSNGETHTYGAFANNTANYSFSYSIKPSSGLNGYALDIIPSNAFTNKLSIYPTIDNDIHLFESGLNGAITLGNYGSTNFRVYGSGGVNGAGQYGNDIRADLVSNSIFNIATNSNTYNWSFGSDGLFYTPANTIIIGNEMGPSIIANTSMYNLANYDDGMGNTAYSGSVAYPNTYQIFSQFYNNVNSGFINLSLDNTNNNINFNINSLNWYFNSNGSTQFPGTIFNSIAIANGTGDIVYPTALDLTKSINKVSDNMNSYYTLADGVEGQIMYIVKQHTVTDQSLSSIGIHVAHAYIGINVLTNQVLYFNGDIITLLFTDGAWQQTGGLWD
jgi:hypothetical protein